MKEIAELLKIFNPKITVDAVKNKIHIIWGQYTRERNKCKKLIKSGSGVDDVYTHKLWFYSEMPVISN